MSVIIDHLEAEKKELLSLIEQAVNDKEFLHAHYHSEALQLINERIDILRGLNDHSYHKKKSLLDKITHLNQMLLSGQFLDQKFQMHLKEMIIQAEDELASLDTTTNDLPKKYSTQVDRLVEQLSLKKIKGFKIILSTEPHLSIELKRSKGNISITISNLRNLVVDSILDEEEDFPKLKSLGFELFPRNGKMVASIAMTQSDVCKEVMTVLSKTILEVFHLSNGKKESFIEILR